jgi:hypothetical protein
MHVPSSTDTLVTWALIAAALSCIVLAWAVLRNDIARSCQSRKKDCRNTHFMKHNAVEAALTLEWPSMRLKSPTRHKQTMSPRHLPSKRDIVSQCDTKDCRHDMNRNWVQSTAACGLVTQHAQQPRQRTACETGAVITPRPLPLSKALYIAGSC